MKNKVCIIGAGICGLTAAHELVKKGYKVDVYESNNYIGGRAFSIRENNKIIEYSSTLFGKFDSLYQYMEDIDIMDNFKSVNLKLDKYKLNYSNSKIKNFFHLLEIINEVGTIDDIYYISMEAVRWKTESYKSYLETVTFEEALLDNLTDEAKKILIQIIEIFSVVKISMSANIIYQLLFDSFGDYKKIDGSINENLFNYWYNYLISNGVNFYLNNYITRNNNSIYSNGKKLNYDAYLFCLSTEGANKIFPNINIKSSDNIITLQIYTKNRILNNYYNIIDTPFKIVYKITDNLISLCITEYNNIGRIYKKLPTDLSNDQLVDECIDQLIDHIKIKKNNIFDIKINNIPLLIINPNNYKYLNDGKTEYPNMFLVGEFSKTEFLAPLMEKACQAGILGSKLVNEYLNEIICVSSL